MAAFDPKYVNAVFQKNLFDNEDLIPIFRQMLGLADYTPFECIGEIDESRLAIKKCVEKGLSGKVINIFKQEILSDNFINWQEIERKCDQVYTAEHAIPDWIFSKISKQL